MKISLYLHGVLRHWRWLFLSDRRYGKCMGTYDQSAGRPADCDTVFRSYDEATEHSLEFGHTVATPKEWSHAE